MFLQRTPLWGLALALLLGLVESSTAQQTIRFAGADWIVRADYGGPGPNYFAAENVRLDSLGRLHLKISKSGSRWTCAEVYTTQYSRYGEHRFLIEGRVDLMDRSQVLGLFLYASDTREVDIEFSRWGRPNESRVGSYTIQPGSAANHSLSFVCHLDSARSTHYFNWQADSITFASMHGHYLHEPASPAEYIMRHTYKGADIPRQNYNLRTHINFWLFNGEAPLDPRYTEVIITDLLLPGIAHSDVTLPAAGPPAKIGSYPNPFNDETVIQWQAPISADMNLTIFDAVGRRIWDWQGLVAAGETKRVRFGGRLWPSGVYFCRISGGTLDQVLKLLLLH